MTLEQAREEFKRTKDTLRAAADAASASEKLSQQLWELHKLARDAHNKAHTDLVEIAGA